MFSSLEISISIVQPENTSAQAVGSSFMAVYGWTISPFTLGVGYLGLKENLCTNKLWTRCSNRHAAMEVLLMGRCVCYWDGEIVTPSINIYELPCKKSRYLYTLCMSFTCFLHHRLTPMQSTPSGEAFAVTSPCNCYQRWNVCSKQPVSWVFFFCDFTFLGEAIPSNALSFSCIFLKLISWLLLRHFHAPTLLRNDGTHLKRDP